MFESVRELVDYKSMVRSLVKREIRGRYKGSILGFIWNFITPLMQILVYIMVFTVVFRVNIEHYPIYLIVSMVPWIMFSDSLICSSGSIVSNGEMLNKIYFPRCVLPISIVLSKFINFLISLGIAFAVILISGYPISLNAMIFIPLAVLVLLLFSTGLSLLLSAIDAYLRDIEYITNVIMMIVIWLTPIMYLRDYFESPVFDTILALNPMTYIIELFQDILYWGCVPSLTSMCICTLLGVGALLVGWVVFHKLERNFSEVL